jgi:hypothetical protein
MVKTIHNAINFIVVRPLKSFKKNQEPQHHATIASAKARRSKRTLQPAIPQRNHPCHAPQPKPLRNQLYDCYHQQNFLSWLKFWRRARHVGKC